MLEEKKVICKSGQGKVGLTQFRPVEPMKGVCVHWGDAGINSIR